MVVSSSREAAVKSERPIKASRTAMKAEASVGLSRLVTCGCHVRLELFKEKCVYVCIPVSLIRPI